MTLRLVIELENPRPRDRVLELLDEARLEADKVANQLRWITKLPPGGEVVRHYSETEGGRRVIYVYGGDPHNLEAYHNLPSSPRIIVLRAYGEGSSEVLVSCMDSFIKVVGSTRIKASAKLVR